VALSSTVYVFDIRLADADRGVYETLALRLARHPSESPEFLVTRLLAYCLEYGEGLSFSKGGLSDPDEPALSVHDLTGARRGWIEIGTPDAARLHKAAKASPLVRVYPHRDVEAWLGRLAGERIHRGSDLGIRVLDRELIGALASRLDRRMDFDLSVAEQTLYVTLGDETLSGTCESRELPG
jgi:uncharacterized protein YaeQ